MSPSTAKCSLEFPVLYYNFMWIFILFHNMYMVDLIYNNVVIRKLLFLSEIDIDELSCILMAPATYSIKKHGTGPGERNLICNFSIKLSELRNRCARIYLSGFLKVVFIDFNHKIIFISRKYIPIINFGNAIYQ